MTNRTMTHFQAVRHSRLYGLLLLPVLLIIGSVALNAQKIAPSPDDLFAEANEYIFAGDYAEALPVLLGLYKNGHTGAGISYKIAECYLNIPGQRTRSIPYLLTAVASVSDSYTGKLLTEAVAPAKSLLFLGIAYRLAGRFNDAINAFGSYEEKLPAGDRDERYITAMHAEKCRNAIEMIESPAAVKADTLSLPVNPGLTAFNPVLPANEQMIVYMDRLKFYDALMVSLRSDSAWLPPENMTPVVGSDGDHLVTGIHPVNSALLFTIDEPYRSGEIYSSSRLNENWSKLEPLDEPVNSQFNETHASFSPDGRFLYFTSDRKGGLGGLDIYKSMQLPTGKWGEPENLGPNVNTPLNEETPFVTPDGKTLFFSSQGHYNMGGYDVFFSSGDSNGNWLPPVNAGYPISTPDDDLFFFPLSSGQIAYQSRFSLTGTQRHLVRYTIEAYANPSRFSIDGKLKIDAEPGFEASSILMEITDTVSGLTHGKVNLNANGGFRQKIPAGVFRFNFSHNNQVLLSRTLQLPANLLTRNLVFTGEIAIPHAVSNEWFGIRDIYFDFDASLIRPSDRPLLDSIVVLMERYPGMKLTVNGYADALGSDAYNLRLSARRAETAARYFLGRSSFAGRITSKGLGESDPVAMNNNPDGSDNPQGRRYNRRVRFVFSQVPEVLEFRYFQLVPETLRYR